MVDEKVRILEKYVPPAAAPLAAKMIDHYQASIKISKSRSTKYGDYRHPFKGEGHRISVNYNLNPFAFLITFVHEFAHLATYNIHKNRVKPHGSEWKVAFQKLMDPFMNLDIFPPDLKIYLQKYLANPAASSCSDLNLMRILEQYDQVKEGIVYIEKIPIGSLFFTLDGRCFRKGEKLRKRFKCEELKSRRFYLFNPLAKVKPAELLEGAA